MKTYRTYPIPTNIQAGGGARIKSGHDQAVGRIWNMQLMYIMCKHLSIKLLDQQEFPQFTAGMGNAYSTTVDGRNSAPPGMYKTRRK